MITTSTSPGYFSVAELGDASTQYYRENGFIVVTDCFSADEIQELRDDAVAICRGDCGALNPAGNHMAEQQPAETPDFTGMTDEEIISQFLCIHFPHKASLIMHRALAQPNAVRVLTSIIGPNVKCMQSMLFIKARGKPGQAWHQDEYFIPTRDRSLCGGWIAMDDATVDNGCLWVIPGSHRRGILWPMYPHNKAGYDCAHEAYDFPYTDANAVPVEVPAGAVVFFNGYLLHKSLPNRKTSGFRRSLVNHYMSAESLLPWYRIGESPDPVGHADKRDIVLVAGKDPYAYKGTEDLAKPMVRSAGQGGCGDGRMDGPPRRAAGH
ncbi:phytanoyl-CoA dioxygenase family protein [Cerasicoccus frondis]|uniref:phytanoyl-CoA dioxygenase family protein n=1 Tax=Cerasicoccus frondis TaxID=490090 RepID=UPI002852A4F6|nr:phytanoyl-CoA dioxygenase family protein [Cerasicoccus frondis]